MGNRRDYIVKGIVEICQKLDEKGFVANHDGNVTAKFENHFLATPTAESKGAITPEMVISLDKEGKKIEGIGKPFSELNLHLAAYEEREETRAVVHAHPPFATARGLVGKPLEISLPEAVVSIGHIIPVADYSMPGSVANDRFVREALRKSDVFMIAGNGVLSVGRNLEEAYLRLELLEHVAKVDYYAATMGPVMTIPEEDLQKLLEKRAKIGLGPKSTNRVAKNVLDNYDQKADDIHLHQLQDLIAKEVNKYLEKS